MTTALPNWVIDLINAVDVHEYEHDKEHHCLGDALNAVPADVVQQARGARFYLAQMPVPTDAEPDHEPAPSGVLADNTNQET